MKDELGKRMKDWYEDALRVSVPRRGYLVVRVDGRGFHQFTKDLERPYSTKLARAMDAAALVLAREMMGCRFAFGQSDEYSFLAADVERESERMWFDGNIQKIASVSASVFTAGFARAFGGEKLATFDARVLSIPRAEEVAKYFLWRQLDASANSLNMLASAHYSHEELLGKTEQEKHDLLHAKGLNWAKEAVEFKRGRVIRRGGGGEWFLDAEPPVFSREVDYLGGLIPRGD
jgi:tRNA(His) 5'-end guanylyltransferase